MEGTPKLVPVHVAEKLLQDYDVALMGAVSLEEKLLKDEQTVLQATLDADAEAHASATLARARTRKALNLARNQAAALAVTIAKKALQDWMTPGTPVFPED